MSWDELGRLKTSCDESGSNKSLILSKMLMVNICILFFLGLDLMYVKLC